MTQEPIDRHEHVRVSDHHQERVVHDLSAEQRQILTRATHLLWLVAAVLEVLILIRVFLKLIAANPASPFAALIYGVTDLFLFPFFGLTATPAANGMVLEISSIIAMLVYFFGFWILAKLIWLLFERPSARTVTTVDAHPEPVVQERVVVEKEPVVEERIVVEKEPVVEERVVVKKQPVIEEEVVVEEEPGVGRRVVQRKRVIDDGS